jgi:hypothetical protein
MADGSGVSLRDEHLVPGRGAQPCGPLLTRLAAGAYSGAVVLEVNTRRAVSREAREADLAEALEFTRKHLDGRAGDTGRAGGTGDAEDMGEAVGPAEPAGPDPVSPRGSVLPHHH